MWEWILGGLLILIATFGILMAFSLGAGLISWVFDRCLFKGHVWAELPTFHVCERCGRLNFRLKDPGAVRTHEPSRFKGDGHTPR